jgi:ferredoxin
LKRLKRPFLSLGKRIVHRTLLRFPGGDAHDPIACTYCPELCRFSCPTAVVSGNDAVTPCNKMGLLHREERWPGQAAAGGPLWPLYDCTGCGRCSEFCVYGMPVAETLFEARKEFAWEPAQAAARALTDEMDPVGDLADELGDGVSSIRRREAFVARNRESLVALVAEEPRSLEFLLSRGHEAGLAWENAFDEASLRTWRERLSGRSWLVHESSWLSRRLGSHAQVAQWVEHARAAGISLVLPFHHGKDCIDCGGEGAYPRLFEAQARDMAREIWARDKHRAQGILCFSQRCASHLRAALGGEVPVVSLSEIPRRVG